jgi:hypothetical protein
MFQMQQKRTRQSRLSTSSKQKEESSSQERNESYIE